MSSRIDGRSQCDGSWCHDVLQPVLFFRCTELGEIDDHAVPFFLRLSMLQSVSSATMVLCSRPS